MLQLLKRVAVDITPLRESRDFRLLITGQVISSLGTQIALVALPVQIFLLSHSPVLVGLLGAFELAPTIAVSLLGGALADRLDRRKILIAAQAGVIAAGCALAAVSLLGSPSVLVVLLLGGALAGSAALDTVTRSAMVPRIVAPAQLRQALAFDYGAYQLALVVGPGVGGVLIAALGVGDAYLLDAGSCLAMAAAAFAMAPQPPTAPPDHASITRSILESFRFVRRNNALAGSFAIDLMAMTTAWPRSMFAVLSLAVYHAGASGTGLTFRRAGRRRNIGGTDRRVAGRRHASGEDRGRRGRRLGRGRRLCWTGTDSRPSSAPVCDRRLRGWDQRRLPDHDQPDRDPGPHAGSNERPLQPRRQQRSSPRGHRVGIGGRADIGCDRGSPRWGRVRVGSGRCGIRVPGPSRVRPRHRRNRAPSRAGRIGAES